MDLDLSVTLRLISWPWRTLVQKLHGDSHGPLAEQMVMELCQSQASAINDVASMRARVEQDRAAFWAAIAEVLTGELLAPSGQPQR